MFGWIIGGMPGEEVGARAANDASAFQYPWSARREDPVGGWQTDDDDVLPLFVNC